MFLYKFDRVAQYAGQILEKDVIKQCFYARIWAFLLRESMMDCCKGRVSRRSVSRSGIEHTEKTWPSVCADVDERIDVCKSWFERAV